MRLSLLPTDDRHFAPYTAEIDENRHLEAAILIGRVRQCDVEIVEPSVSRRHCRIVVEPSGGTVVLQDLGSTNGTFVNGMRLASSCELRDGDEIVVGKVPLTVVFSGASSLWERVAERYRELEAAPPHKLRLARVSPA